MSLRSTLEAFAPSLIKRKGSHVPLRDALENFARFFTEEASTKSSLSNRAKLNRLAQRVLLLSTAAAQEDNKFLAGACTLLAGALTKRVWSEVYSDDRDGRWLATWPDLLVSCIDGDYAQAEELVCHLLDPAWTGSLSSRGVDVLLERLHELPDATGEDSSALTLLYAQYRSSDVFAVQSVYRSDREETGDASREDAEIAADGAGIIAHSPEVLDPVIESSVTNFIPANDDIVDKNSGDNNFDAVDADVFGEMSLFGDAHAESASALHDSDLIEGMTSLVDLAADSSGGTDGTVVDKTLSSVTPGETTESELANGESTGGNVIEGDGAPRAKAELADMPEDDLQLGQQGTVQEGTVQEGTVQESDVRQGVAQKNIDPFTMVDTSSKSQSDPNIPIDLACTDEPTDRQIGMFDTAFPETPAICESPGSHAASSLSDAASDGMLESPHVNTDAEAVADGAMAEDAAMPDLFDDLGVDVADAADNTRFNASKPASARVESVDADTSTTVPNVDDACEMQSQDATSVSNDNVERDDLEQIDISAETSTSTNMLKEWSGTESAQDSVFDSFDGTAFGGEPTINIGDFVLPEEALATTGEQVLFKTDDTELLSDLNLPLSGSNDIGVVETTAAVTPLVTPSGSDPRQHDASRAVPGAKSGLSRAAMQIVEVMLAELPEVETELSICAGLGASPATDRKLVGEAAHRCAEVLQRYSGAADSVGFVGLAKAFDVASEHVLGVAQAEVLTELQVGMFTAFPGVVRTYLQAPYAAQSAQPLLDWIANDGWATPIAIDNPEVLRSLLANPDLSAIDEDVPIRPERANPGDVLLALPEDADREVLDGLLQELPLQSEEFSAAIGNLVRGGGMEDILVAQRIAHTIKGSGNTVGIRGLATLTHNVEDILMLLAQENRLPSRPLAGMLMNVADCLQAMTESLLGMGPPPDDAVQVLQDVLDWANLIDREGLPQDDFAPESKVRPSATPESPVVIAKVAPGSSSAKVSADANPAHQFDTKKSDDDSLEALLRVPTRLVDQMLTTAGESIILTGQLRERVRRGLADVHGMLSQFERQRQLGSELEELIDVKDFSRRQAQQDSEFDALEMDQYNELHSTARHMVETATDAREFGKSIVSHLSELDEMLISQEDLNRDSQDTVLRTRMVAVKSVFPRLQRSVRQTCRATDKQVELHLSGGDTPMDSDALNRIVDPLMHLLRNAIDHGIEDSETRLRVGKSAVGNVHLVFHRDGNNIVINCRDDGAGLDFDAIRHTAEERGLIGADASPEALKQIILRSNFSTRSHATQVSGRGIGLDAVHNGVSRLGGTMSVDSEMALGCTFEMRLPFNLISSHALLVQAGQEVIAIASRGVEQIVHGRDGELRHFGDKLVFQIDDNVYPATSLEVVIGANQVRRGDLNLARPIVLTRTDEGVVAVSVEAVIGSRDLVVKSLGKNLPKLRGIVGATILGDGQVASVVDLPELLSHRNVGVEDVTSTDISSSSDRGAGVVLVVDDSMSARKALAQFMQDSGYTVRTARDGIEATQIMDTGTPDLVLADLEMPRMNGIELTVHMRSRTETANVPVVMITSRTTVKHREQAMTAGVNVYLTKPYYEDTLIETVRGLIAGREVRRDERSAA